MKTVMSLCAIAILCSTNIYADYPSLNDGDCNARPLALNADTGKLEMDVSDCEIGGSTWFLEVDGHNKPGYFAPEHQAAYWAANLPHIAGQAAHWEFRGQQPDARFHSYQSYDSDGNSKDFVFDAELTPSPGSINWVRDKVVYPGAATTEYILPAYEVQSDIDIPTFNTGEPTALYFSRDSSTESNQNTVVRRVYFNDNRNQSNIPDGMNTFDWMKRGQVKLPSIYYVVDDTSKPHFNTVEEVRNGIDNDTRMAKIAKITQFVGDVSKDMLDRISLKTRIWQKPTEWQMNDFPASTYSRMWKLEEEPIMGYLWSKLLNLLPKSSAFPNEVTRYFVGGVNPSFGDVHVTRFKMPRTIEPDHGDVIDPSEYDLRFLSICTHLSLTLYTIDCLKDSTLHIDDDGYVTFVMSDTQSAPIDPVTGEPATNWVDYPSISTLVLIRHMLPSETFTQSLYHYGKKCQEEGSCAEAAQDIVAIKEWTGEYYPISTYCSVNNFEYNRCEWTFNWFQEWLYKKKPHLFKRWFG